MIYSILLVVHVLIAVSVIGLVLLQQGEGADAGAAFGSGASSTVFGARGSASFLTRATAVLATIFFITSLSLAYLANRQTKPESIITAPASKQEQVIEKKPAAPVSDVPVAD